MSSADRQRIHIRLVHASMVSGTVLLTASRRSHTFLQSLACRYGKAAQQHHGENMERFYSSFCRVNEAADHPKSIQADGDDGNAKRDGQNIQVSVPWRG